MTRKERTLVNELHSLILEETFFIIDSKISYHQSELKLLKKMNNIIYKLKFPKLNTKNIEIQ